MASQSTVHNQPTQGNGVEATPVGANYRPAVDIVEKPTELVILAAMPGAAIDKIDIRFEDRSLIIHAQIEPRQDAATTHHLLHEYGVGDFHRVFQVNEDVDPRKIRAEYQAGVLAIHLPKAEAILPRKIEVQSGK
jgi:HSP20 family molecular chaperone IbpA